MNQIKYANNAKKKNTKTYEKYVASLNNYDEYNFMHVDNKCQIERLTGVKVIAEVKKGEKDLNISEHDLLKIFG